jgi:hypothetical protein
MWKSRDKAAQFPAVFQAICQRDFPSQVETQNRSRSLHVDSHISKSMEMGNAFSGYYFPGPIECEGQCGC